MKLSKWLLLLYCAEAFLVACWIFLTPSEKRNAVILWLSRERLLLLAIAICLWLASVAVAIVAFRFPAALEAVEHRLDSWCLEQKQLVASLIPLLVIPLVGLWAILDIHLTPLKSASHIWWAPRTFSLLWSVVDASLPILLFFLLIVFEFGVYLAIRYRQGLLDAEQRRWQQVAPALACTFIALATLFYWAVLAFQLRFFKINPAWYWAFRFVPFTGGDILFAIVGLGFLVLIYWVLIRHRWILPGLLLLFAFGWFLQNSVGLMGGGGFATVSGRYFSTYHKVYVLDASQNHSSILDNIRNYEAVYGTSMFARTKPPGLISFYIALESLVNRPTPQMTDAMRYADLSTFITYAFPLIAMLMVFAIYAFTRKYLAGNGGALPVVAPLLFVLCPNVVLFSLFPDQAIYPLLFLLGVILTIVVVRRGSFILAFGLGAFLYLAVFFAFTMLPLYPFVVLYLVLNYWLNRRDLDIRRQLGMAIAIAAGTIALYFLFRAVLNYDFLPTFSRMVDINHRFDFYQRIGKTPPNAPEPLSVRIQQILGAIWLNNLDFSSAIGYPIYVLFLIQGFHLLKRVIQGLARPGDVPMAALLISFTVLNLAGTAQGEVPRLWLFWVPMVVILAAMELGPWVERHPRILLILSVAQLITIFLTYHFQDLRM